MEIFVLVLFVLIFSMANSAFVMAYEAYKIRRKPQDIIDMLTEKRYSELWSEYDE